MSIRPVSLPRELRRARPASGSRFVGISAWAAASTVLLAARAAHAGNTAAEFSVFDTNGYFPTLPDRLTPAGTVYTNTDPESQPQVLQRELNGSIASGGASAYWTIGSDLRVVHRQTWMFPLIGFAIGGALGQSNAVTSSFDGTIVEMQPWTMGYFGLLLPGIGLRAHSLHLSVSFTLRGVLSVLWMNGLMAVGADNVGFTASNVSLGLRASLEACYRLDVKHRACLFVEPNVYEFGVFNGGSVGLRWDLGS